MENASPPSEVSSTSPRDAKDKDVHSCMNYDTFPAQPRVTCEDTIKQPAQGNWRTLFAEFLEWLQQGNATDGSSYPPARSNATLSRQDSPSQAATFADRPLCLSEVLSHAAFAAVHHPRDPTSTTASTRNSVCLAIPHTEPANQSLNINAPRCQTSNASRAAPADDQPVLQSSLTPRHQASSPVARGNLRFRETDHVSPMDLFQGPLRFAWETFMQNGFRELLHSRCHSKGSSHSIPGRCEECLCNSAGNPIARNHSALPFHSISASCTQQSEHSHCASPLAKSSWMPSGCCPCPDRAGIHSFQNSSNNNHHCSCNPPNSSSSCSPDPTASYSTLQPLDSWYRNADKDTLLREKSQRLNPRIDMRILLLLASLYCSAKSESAISHDETTGSPDTRDHHGPHSYVESRNSNVPSGRERGLHPDVPSCYTERLQQQEKSVVSWRSGTPMVSEEDCCRQTATEQPLTTGSLQPRVMDVNFSLSSNRTPAWWPDVACPVECQYRFDARLRNHREEGNFKEEKEGKPHDGSLGRTRRSGTEYSCSYPGVSWNTRMQSWLVYFEDAQGRKSRTFNPKRLTPEQLALLPPDVRAKFPSHAVEVAMHCACIYAARVRWEGRLRKSLGYTSRLTSRTGGCLGTGRETRGSARRRVPCHHWSSTATTMNTAETSSSVLGFEIAGEHSESDRRSVSWSALPTANTCREISPCCSASSTPHDSPKLILSTANTTVHDTASTDIAYCCHECDMDTRTRSSSKHRSEDITSSPNVQATSGRPVGKNQGRVQTCTTTRQEEVSSSLQEHGKEPSRELSSRKTYRVAPLSPAGGRLAGPSSPEEAVLMAVFRGIQRAATEAQVPETLKAVLHDQLLSTLEDTRRHPSTACGCPQTPPSAHTGCHNLLSTPRLCLFSRVPSTEGAMSHEAGNRAEATRVYPSARSTSIPPERTDPNHTYLLEEQEEQITTPDAQNTITQEWCSGDQPQTISQDAIRDTEVWEVSQQQTACNGFLQHDAHTISSDSNDSTVAENGTVEPPVLYSPSRRNCDGSPTNLPLLTERSIKKVNECLSLATEREGYPATKRPSGLAKKRRAWLAETADTEHPPYAKRSALLPWTVTETVSA